MYTGRTRVDYRYTPQGIRTISIDWNDTNLDGTFAAGERTGSVEYLIDNANFTGYQQTILETVKNAAGQATKRTTYTYGLDEITQTVTDLAASGSVLATNTQVFAHDGHGSVRALFGAAAAIAQVFTYSAYGELLAIHNGSGTLQPLASSLTSVLHNGEGLDARTGLYNMNMRARWYSPTNARWERLDPFAGNPTDPFSFNKYGFVHGNPVMGTDPTGLFGISVSLAGMSIRGGMVGMGAGVAIGYGYAVHVTGEWSSVTHLKYMLIGGLAGFAIGATSGAYIGYATNAARGLGSGGALHNFTKIAEKLWTVPSRMRTIGLAANKGKVFAAFVVGAAAGSWAAAAEDHEILEGVGELSVTSLALETPLSIVYQSYMRQLIASYGLTRYLAGSATLDITIAFTIGFNAGYFASNGVESVIDMAGDAVADFYSRRS